MMKKSAAERMERKPMVQWEGEVDRMEPQELADVANAAEGMAIRYTRLARYLSRRAMGSSHDKAVKAQNEAARAVRRALGFAYASDNIEF